MTASGALACGVVCTSVLVFLPAVALTSAGAALIAWVDGALAWGIALAVPAVVVGWAWLWRQSIKAEVRPARSTFLLMAVATLFLMLALGWPRIESGLKRMIGEMPHESVDRLRHVSALRDREPLHGRAVASPGPRDTGSPMGKNLLMDVDFSRTLGG